MQVALQQNIDPRKLVRLRRSPILQVEFKPGAESTLGLIEVHLLPEVGAQASFCPVVASLSHRCWYRRVQRQ